MKYIILLSLLAAGCTTTARMNYADVDHFTIDCSKKREQLEFLNTQWPSDKDRLINAFTISSTGGYILSNADGTYKERRKLNDGYYTNSLRILIYQIESTCPN
jgi:hypothetical protein